MKIRIRKLKYIFIIILIIAFALQGVYILSSKLTFSLFQKIILMTIQGLCVIGFTHFHNIGKDERSIQKSLNYANIFICVVYILNLIYVLFLDPDFGRRLISYATWDEYIENNVNLTLFSSIRLFVNGYRNGYVTLEALLRNILGNVIVFMPMSYFLPLFFKKQRKWLWFILTIVFIVFGVELLQVIFKTGSGDVDDLFLNVCGAVFMYGFLKLCSLFYMRKAVGRN